MRLTNSMRDAFIAAVMLDVPMIDYNERVRKVVVDDAVASLPPLIQRAWNDSASRPYIMMGSDYFLGMVCYPYHDRRGYELSPTAKQAVEELVKSSKEQAKARNDLAASLKGVAYSVTTRKALATALPEFVKYMPPENEVSSRSVPALANVVAAFMKAGWPKNTPQES